MHLSLSPFLLIVLQFKYVFQIFTLLSVPRYWRLLFEMEIPVNRSKSLGVCRNLALHVLAVFGLAFVSIVVLVDGIYERFRYHVC